MKHRWENTKKMGKTQKRDNRPRASCDLCENPTKGPKKGLKSYPQKPIPTNKKGGINTQTKRKRA